MSTPTRPTTDRAERLTPPAPKKRRARAASERLEANLHGIAAMFDAWTEEEWTDMVNASDAQILDDNRDYIEEPDDQGGAGDGAAGRGRSGPRSER